MKVRFVGELIFGMIMVLMSGRDDRVVRLLRVKGVEMVLMWIVSLEMDDGCDESEEICEVS